jgi:hypothetical protein
MNDSIGINSSGGQITGDRLVALHPNLSNDNEVVTARTGIMWPEFEC